MRLTRPDQMGINLVGGTLKAFRHHAFAAHGSRLGVYLSSSSYAALNFILEVICSYLMSGPVRFLVSETSALFSLRDTHSHL